MKMLCPAAALAIHAILFMAMPTEARPHLPPPTEWMNVELASAALPPIPEPMPVPEEAAPETEPEPERAKPTPRPMRERPAPEPAVEEEAAPLDPSDTAEDAAPSEEADQPELDEPTPVPAVDSAASSESGETVAAANAESTGRARAGTGRRVRAAGPVVGHGGRGSSTTSRSGASARPVRLEYARWNCAWPSEAEYEPINEQIVTLQVVVNANGRVEKTEVVSDPGYGFGRAARACAQRATFLAARDASGAAIRATSPPIRVRFVR